MNTLLRHGGSCSIPFSESNKISIINAVRVTWRVANKQIKIQDVHEGKATEAYVFPKESNVIDILSWEGYTSRKLGSLERRAGDFIGNGYHKTERTL